MSNYATMIKHNLTTIIETPAASPETFVKSPGKDFTRHRKLSFESMIKLLLTMNEDSLYQELLIYFEYDINTASS